MSFKEAISQRIISDYKIPTIAVSDERVARVIKENRILNLRLRDLDEAEARAVATGVALKRVEKQGVTAPCARTPSRCVPHVDDLVQPRAEQITRSCRLVLLRPHRSLRCSDRIMLLDSRESRKRKLQASRASDTETLQSQVNKAAQKRRSLSGLEVFHGRLLPIPTVNLLRRFYSDVPEIDVTCRPFRALSRVCSLIDIKQLVRKNGRTSDLYQGSLGGGDHGNRLGNPRWPESGPASAEFGRRRAAQAQGADQCRRLPHAHLRPGPLPYAA